MKSQRGSGRWAATWSNAVAARLGAVAGVVCLVIGASALAQEQMGQVTLLAGAPRMVGESIRPLQAILTGQQIETGEEDAAGLLVEDIVFHVGVNSTVNVVDEPGRKRIVLDRGFVVFYTDAGTASEVMVETPFGRLTARPGSASPAGTGWFSVRHDPAEPGVSPAVSTFAAMEGVAEAVGTAPQAGPHTLQGGMRWRIVQGEIPGPPEQGDEREAANQLREMLHRQAAEVLRAQTTDLTRLVSLDVGRGLSTPDVVAPERQSIVDPNAAAQDRTPRVNTPLPTAPVEPVEQERLVFHEPTAIAAGRPNSAAAQYVSYQGAELTPDWNQFLTSVNGNPAFSPQYLTDFTNGGFSYLQLAGPDAQLAENNGETFLATSAEAASGWALFTPQIAVADSGFNPDSGLARLVNEGLQGIAFGEHPALPDDPNGGGRIGGNGVDAASAFASASGNLISLNPDRPAGYPRLDQAGDTTGLEFNGEALSDQIAALGTGLNPQALSEDGPQLLFISAAEVDALGRGFNFDGDPIEITDLDLPDDRTIETVSGNAASAATPLASDTESTVGIQFAARGETIAVIHHTGLGDTDATVPTSDHFEVQRGERESIVRWRDDGRVAGPGGQLLEAEDLADDEELRNELFALIGEEVNNLVPPERQTVVGPAYQLADAGAARSLRPQPGSLLRVGDTAPRRLATLHRSVGAGGARARALRSLKPAGGALVRPTSSVVNRRHLGRVSP